MKSKNETWGSLQGCNCSKINFPAFPPYGMLYLLGNVKSQWTDDICFWWSSEKSVEFIFPLLILIAPFFLSLVSAQAVGQGQLQSLYVATETYSPADMCPPTLLFLPQYPCHCKPLSEKHSSPSTLSETLFRSTSKLNCWVNKDIEK